MQPRCDVALPVVQTLTRAEESILVGGCQGFILIPADQYPEFVRGTRLAAYLAPWLGLVCALLFAFLDD